MRRASLILPPLGVFLLSGCVATAPAGQEPAVVGMPNPASVYCAEQGGESVIRDTPEGQTGDCHLPDGRVVDEWDLYRANHPG